jgi:hypothetical protein
LLKCLSILREAHDILQTEFQQSFDRAVLILSTLMQYQTTDSCCILDEAIDAVQSFDTQYLTWARRHREACRSLELELIGSDQDLPDRNIWTAFYNLKSERDRIQAENSRLAQSLSETAREKTSVEDRFRDASMAITDLTTTQQRLDTMTALLAQVTAERDTLKQDLADARALRVTIPPVDQPSSPGRANQSPLQEPQQHEALKLPVQPEALQPIQHQDSLSQSDMAHSLRVVENVSNESTSHDRLIAQVQSLLLVKAQLEKRVNLLSDEVRTYRDMVKLRGLTGSLADTQQSFVATRTTSSSALESEIQRLKTTVELLGSQATARQAEVEATKAQLHQCKAAVVDDAQFKALQLELDHARADREAATSRQLQVQRNLKIFEERFSALLTQKMQLEGECKMLQHQLAQARKP